jgi:exosortase/archaeosortase family protein
MGLDTWISRLAKNRRALALVGLIVAFTGVSMVLNPTHWREMEWVGIPFLVVGFAILAWAAWPKTFERRPETQSLGSRLIHTLTWQGRLVKLFPVAGIGVIAADLAYNFLLSSSPDLLTEDIIVLLTAAVLLAYGFVPGRFSRERDFVLLFSIGLDLILVAPLLVVRHFVGNSVHAVPGLTAPGLSFTPVKMTTPVTLVISTACSGIYSFGIFASAYCAFLLTEYERTSWRLWFILGLGFLASYAANLLRMVFIVLVGYYADSAETDLQNLLLAHSYAGWIIFLAWLALFWGLLFRFLRPWEPGADVVPESEKTIPGRPKRAGCGLCGEPLSPMIPAARCVCGAIYHRGCVSADSRCTFCSRTLSELGGETGKSPVAWQTEDAR